MKWGVELGTEEVAVARSLPERRPQGGGESRLGLGAMVPGQVLAPSPDAGRPQSSASGSINVDLPVPFSPTRNVTGRVKRRRRFRIATPIRYGASLEPPATLAAPPVERPLETIHPPPSNFAFTRS